MISANLPSQNKCPDFSGSMSLQHLSTLTFCHQINACIVDEKDRLTFKLVITSNLSCDFPCFPWQVMYFVHWPIWLLYNRAHPDTGDYIGRQCLGQGVLLDCTPCHLIRASPEPQHQVLAVRDTGSPLNDISTPEDVRQRLDLSSFCGSHHLVCHQDIRLQRDTSRMPGLGRVDRTYPDYLCISCNKDDSLRNCPVSGCHTPHSMADREFQAPLYQTLQNPSSHFPLLSPLGILIRSLRRGTGVSLYIVYALIAPPI